METRPTTKLDEGNNGNMDSQGLKLGRWTDAWVDSNEKSLYPDGELEEVFCLPI